MLYKILKSWICCIYFFFNLEQGPSTNILQEHTQYLKVILLKVSNAQLLYLL